MKVEISVTAEDIARGLRNDCRNCPIAHALKRALPEWDEAIANLEELKLLRRDGGLLKAWTPRQAFFFMNRFDYYRTVTPFTFTAYFR